MWIVTGLAQIFFIEHECTYISYIQHQSPKTTCNPEVTFFFNSLDTKISFRDLELIYAIIKTKAFNALQNILLSKPPFKTQPQIEKEDVT
jgi:hypothetical protein